MNKQIWLLIIFCAAFLSFPVAAQTGGTYDLSHSVITSGGGSNSTGGSFSVSGTVGQNIAGTISTGTSPTNNQYSLRGGFWSFDSFVPTAAPVSISGRVLTTDGNGIKNVRLILTDAGGTVRSTQSGSSGVYRFEEIEPGQIYILTVVSRNYFFAEPTRILNVLEEMTDLDFIGGVRLQSGGIYNPK